MVQWFPPHMVSGTAKETPPTADKAGMRTWTITTTYQGKQDLAVMEWPWQRQAYRFVIDWFTDDPELQRIELVDDSGRADRLVLAR